MRAISRASFLFAGLSSAGRLGESVVIDTVLFKKCVQCTILVVDRSFIKAYSCWIPGGPGVEDIRTIRTSIYMFASILDDKSVSVQKRAMD